MKHLLLLILCFTAQISNAADCYYGNDKLFSKNISDLRLLSNFQQSATAYPYYSYHYNGRSVSAEQFEKLKLKEKQRMP